MSNMTMTVAHRATALATPTASWITVRDGLGRPHLEMRWSAPTASSQPAATSTAERHAA